jgi:3',5'-cyclic AMP phosphodiesterase CpdA
MRKLQAAGIQVFVVPGNHDVNNPHAFRYASEKEIPVPNVSPELFSWIYRHCGYGQAVARDPHSLSYVAEPAKGLWLIAMDSCRYDDHEANGTPATEGRFTPQTLDWVLKMIRLGKARGKQLIGMMHHGAVEHYAGQSVLFPEYVVAGWESVSKQLAEAGLEVVFTGHYHANDVTRRTMEGGSSLLDIETGSLVTFPNPFRVVTLRPGAQLDVDSRFITRINYNTGGIAFPEYSERYLTEGLVGIATSMLQMQYGLPEGEPTLTYARQLAEAFKAHYEGDESPSADTLTLIDDYLKSGNPIGVLLGQYLGALWTDLAPEDTALDVDLPGGAAAMAVGE